MARRGTGIISVLISGDATPFDRAIAGAATGLDRFARTVGVAMAGAAAAVGVAAFKIGKDSISAASDLNESINAVNVAFLDAADSVLKLGETSAEAMGVSRTEFNAAAVRFSAFAERVVGEGGDVAGFIGDISVRAADFASVFNIDVAEALQVFQSGLSGEAEPLKRFGINLLDSEVKAYALRTGLIDVGETMTEQEKVQARYGLLMEATAKTAGDFANTSDGLANQQRILSARLEDTRAALGEALLPAMSTIVSTVADNLLPVFERFAGWFQENEAEITGFISNVLERIITTVGNVISTFREWYQEHGPSVIESFQEIAEPVQSIWNNLGDIVTGVRNLGGEWDGASGPGIVFAAALRSIAADIVTIATFIDDVTDGINRLTAGLNRLADSTGFSFLRELGGERGLREALFPLLDPTRLTEALRETGRFLAEGLLPSPLRFTNPGERGDPAFRDSFARGNINITVTSADPNAVVDAIRKYERQNGPIGVTVR